MPSRSQREINGLHGTAFAKMQNNLQKRKTKAAYLHKKTACVSGFMGKTACCPAKSAPRSGWHGFCYP